MRITATRRRPLLGITALWLLATVGVYALAAAPGRADAVVVTHWAAGHLTPPDRLLPVFARQFNAAGHRTASGKRIEVRPVKVDSFQQADALAASVERGVVTEPAWGEPTIVSPVADYWLADVNHRVGRTVVDLARTEELAIAWTGIVTYREMAKCLGWPEKELGYADIVALRADPRGWASCPTARAEWGREPLMSFSDPNSSTTGRSVLFGLYAAAAEKPSDRLTEDDVADPRIAQFVKKFQGGVDHYVPNSLVMQTKMTLGYSHIYWVAEDVLVQLYQGKTPVTAPPGTKVRPLSTSDMVFIYPKEGSVAHNNPAGIVQAPWVSDEQAEAARQWIAFLREDAQQSAFMDEGFRPATALPRRCPICGGFGLDPNKPSAVLGPIDPAAGQAIVRAWDEVKKPGVVTFAVDVSGSMQGAKLEQAKKGLIQALDGLSKNTSVGLVTFSGSVNTAVPIAPIEANRFLIAEQVGRMQATGGTALYEALDRAIALTDAAPGGPDTIRGVVVLTDGQANGTMPLHDLVTMSTRAEVPIARFNGHLNSSEGTDQDGAAVPKTGILGTGLTAKTAHPIHVFYVGVGSDADLEIGRILAEATNSASQGTTESSLAGVLATFGKYF